MKSFLRTIKLVFKQDWVYFVFILATPLIVSISGFTGCREYSCFFPIIPTIFGTIFFWGGMTLLYFYLKASLAAKISVIVCSLVYPFIISFFYTSPLQTLLKCNDFYCVEKVFVMPTIFTVIILLGIWSLYKQFFLFSHDMIPFFKKIFSRKNE